MALYDKPAKCSRRPMPKWHMWLVQDRAWDAKADPFQASIARMFGVPGHAIGGPYTHTARDMSGPAFTVGAA